jgi:hypothetical protein
MKSMNLPDLLSACFSSSTQFLAADGLRDGSLVWEDLVQIAEEELVLPALRGRLNDIGVLSQIPAELANFLASVEELSFERNQAILAELGSVASLLNEAGIEPLLLKGTAYCVMGIYRNPASRYLGDVDFLIPEPQLETAVEVLSKCGFEQDDSYPLGRFKHHYPALWRAGSPAYELHHSLGMGICRSLLPASEMWERSIVCEWQGARVRVPCPEHLMTHLIMHSQFHHPYNERIWPPLRAMHDLALVQNHFNEKIDWAAIERRFRAVGEFPVLAMHLLQVREVLGLETPFPISLTPFTYLRWLRRKLLRKWPPLRFVDPVYMYSTLLMRRLRLLQGVLREPGGWRCLVKEFSGPGLYRRFIVDLIEGSGR